LISAEPYRLPLRTLFAVATGEVDETDLALLVSAQRSRLLLALAAILELAKHPDEGRPRDDVPATRPATAWALLGTMQHSAPEAVEAVLHDPTVGAWAFQLLRRLTHGAVVTPTDAPAWAGATLLGSLAAAAAIRARARCSLRVPARDGQLWLPSLGLTGRVGRGDWAVVGVECGPSGTVVFGDSGSVRLPDDLSRPAEGWSPLPRIRVGAQEGAAGGVMLDHLSPYRDFRSLSDPVELSQEALRAWHIMAADSFVRLGQGDPDAHRMVTGTVRSLVPADAPSVLRPISVSVPDAYGLVMISRPSDASVLAATLIHEARHQLLTAVGDLTPLFVPLRDGPEPVYFAPWREDPRPLRGLLYGAHAFAGVTSFWRERRPLEGERADFEFALHRWQLRTALAALRNAPGLTPAGAYVVSALAESSARWWTEPVEGAPGRLAQLCCRDLWAGWRAAHLTVGESEADDLARRWLSGCPPPVSLPAGRALATRSTSRGGARTWLARLWLDDREAFDRVRSDLAAGAVNPWGTAGATPADAALVAGDTEEALERFRRADPTPGAWTGVGLAAEWPASPLVERPELVLALHAALARIGAEPPGPEELAQWLGSRLGNRRSGSDAQHVDVAVGPP
jgi:HEXXH motif-containing protein